MRLPTSASAPAVVATGLRHSYGPTTALDGVDLRVAPGSVFALLGPNGSGKTTIIRILSTLLTADTGTATVLGHDVRTEADAVRRLIAVTGQFAAVDGLLSGRQNLVLLARLLLLPRREARQVAEDLLERFGLTDAADRLVSTYSGGMRRRLDLAMTLVGRPRLVFLDEPTTGLDPRSRRALWEEVRRLLDDGVTVFLTTQYLEEADQLADRIAVLDHGRVVAEGTPEELKRRVGGAQVRLAFGTAHDRDRALTSLTPLTSLRAGTTDDEQLEVRVPVDGDAGSVRRLLAQLPDDLELDDLAIVTPTLDDVFVVLTDTDADNDTAGSSAAGSSAAGRAS